MSNCLEECKYCELRAEDNIRLCKEIDDLNSQLAQAQLLLGECKRFLCMLSWHTGNCDREEIENFYKTKLTNFKGEG